MVESSLPWGGVAVGDKGPYTDDQWSDTWRKLLTRDRTLEGVLPDYLNELAVSNPAGLTIRVASGGAVVDGKVYDNTANVDNVGVAPGGGSNFYTVVLDKDFVAQTVRVSILGPNVVAPPAVTQADGVNWEVALATVEITSGSVVTVTDVRVYCHYNTEISNSMIPDDEIDGDKLVDTSVDAVKLNDGAGSGVDADLLDGVQGSEYVNTLLQINPSGDLTLTNVATLMPGATAALAAGTYLVSLNIGVSISGAAGQYAYIRAWLFLNGVQQGSLENWQFDVPSTGRQIKMQLGRTWKLIVPSTPLTLEIRLDKVVGSTATAVAGFGESHILVLKI